jgi:hypothetical protein
MLTRMPFGKFKNRLLSELDDDYVLWLLCLEDLREPFLSTIHSEADRRMAEAYASVGPDAQGDDR